MQKEIMAQAVIQKEKERVKTTRTRQEVEQELYEAKKDLDIVRGDKYEQARKIRDLQLTIAKKDAKIEMQNNTIDLQRQQMAEMKKYNIAGKLFDPTAPYTVWNEFLPNSPSKTTLKEPPMCSITDQSDEGQRSPRFFNNMTKFYAKNPSMDHSSAATTSIFDRKLSVIHRDSESNAQNSKLVTAAHTRHRSTVSKQNKSHKLLEQVEKAQEKYRKARRPTSQSITFKEKQKESYERRQPVPRPQSIAEILAIA